MIVGIIKMWLDQGGISEEKIIDIFEKSKFQVIEEDLKKIDDCCSVCLESFNISEEVIKLDCPKKHIFHFKCIKNWLKI